MTTATLSETKNGGLNIALWVVQALLALAFIAAGIFKTTTPIDELAQKMTWVARMPVGLVRFIGASELAGGLGLLLPSLTRIMPGLTALAGTGLATIMVLAMGTHIANAEWKALPINLAIGGLAAFVAWGRARKAPISPRS